MKISISNKLMKSGTGGFVLILTAVTVMVGTPIREVKAQTPRPDQINELLEQARALYEELLPISQRLGDETLTTRMRNLRAQWVEARGHMQARRYQQAATLARRNLDQLRTLATAIRRLAQRMPYYSRLAERNQELLQLLQRSVGPDAPPEVLRQLTLAAGAVERAQHLRQRGRLLQSFRLMEQADNTLRQVLRYVDRSGLSPESVQREIEETGRRIERLEGAADLVEPAREALERAKASQAEAGRLLAAGDLRQALAHTLTARTALRLASRLTTGSLTSEDVAAAIGHCEELMEVHSELANSTVPAVRSLWQQAGRQLDRARSRLDAGRLRPALEAAQTASKLIVNAARKAGGPPPPQPPPER